MKSYRQQTPNQMIDAGAKNSVSVPLELQPVFDPVQEKVFGYEFLYRGAHPDRWIDVDTHVLKFLSETPLNKGTIFVNLSNEALLSLPAALFRQATTHNKVIFELSEDYAIADTFNRVADRVNSLTALGMQFALDDFGNGRDGLHRLYTLNKIACIKVDGAFIKLCMLRSDAKLALSRLVDQWKCQGMQIIAEWVESPESLAFANSVGFDLMQGWYIDELAKDKVWTGMPPVEAPMPPVFANEGLSGNSLPMDRSLCMP